jgi:hypothetical protein
MEIYMPSKEEWELIKGNISTMAEAMQQFKELLEKNNLHSEHFPEYMTIDIAAKYLRCGLGRVKSMIYKQKLLPTHHIDLTTTVYVSKKDIDELKYTVIAMRGIEKIKMKLEA